MTELETAGSRHTCEGKHRREAYQAGSANLSHLRSVRAMKIPASPSLSQYPSTRVSLWPKFVPLASIYDFFKWIQVPPLCTDEDSVPSGAT